MNERKNEIRILLTTFAMCSMGAHVWAQKYDTPSAANAVESFQKQGEYFGVSADGSRLGAWLVGKAGNKYEVTFLPGGLLTLLADTCGGWDGKTRYRGAGDQTFDKLSSPSGYTAAVTGAGNSAVMTVKGPADKSYTLRRVDRKSPTLDLQPKVEWNPEVWFKKGDAASVTANWKAEGNQPKLTEEGYLNYGILSSKSHGQIYLHIELRSPYCPNTDISTQDRGNSGIYLRSIYEMQVYDSFGGDVGINQLGAIYSVKAPSVNASLPPLKFQTYDCWFTPKKSDGSWPRMTVYLNGVLVQDNTEVTSDNTEGGKNSDPLKDNPLFLQNHGNNVCFNNIWLVRGPNMPTWASISSAAVALVPRDERYSISKKISIGKNQLRILGSEPLLVGPTPLSRSILGRVRNLNKNVFQSIIAPK